MLLAAACVPALRLWRHVQVETRLRQALAPALAFQPVERAGTNTILALDRRAVAVLLDWARAREPAWYRWLNPIRTRLQLAPWRRDNSTNMELARVGFTILRERAVSAVPELERRLQDGDPNMRRASARILGAIGPAIGRDGFAALTNCLADRDQEVRNDTIWTLQFHGPNGYPAEAVLPVFLAGLHDPYTIARQNAMIGLLRMGSNAAPARSEIARAQSDADPGVRTFASNWLHGDPEYFRSFR